MSLTLDQARTILRASLADGRARGLKPLAVAIVDAGGHTIAFEREDGASPGRFAVAHGKANACVMLGLPGSALEARGDQQAYFVQAMNGLFGGDFVPVRGGVLVRDAAGRVIGAVGVTGDSSENDALVACAGIRAAGLTAQA